MHVVVSFSLKDKVLSSFKFFVNSTFKYRKLIGSPRSKERRTPATSTRALSATIIRRRCKAKANRPRRRSARPCSPPSIPAPRVIVSPDFPGKESRIYASDLSERRVPKFVCDDKTFVLYIGSERECCSTNARYADVPDGFNHSVCLTNSLSLVGFELCQYL